VIRGNVDRFVLEEVQIVAKHLIVSKNPAHRNHSMYRSKFQKSNHIFNDFQVVARRFLIEVSQSQFFHNVEIHNC
jgi:hypothetical protein